MHSFQKHCFISWTQKCVETLTFGQEGRRRRRKRSVQTLEDFPPPLPLLHPPTFQEKFEPISNYVTFPKKGEGKENGGKGRKKKKGLGRNFEHFHTHSTFPRVQHCRFCWTRVYFPWKRGGRGGKIWVGDIPGDCLGGRGIVLEKEIKWKFLRGSGLRWRVQNPKERVSFTKSILSWW